jgi:hypothetical protein
MTMLNRKCNIFVKNIRKNTSIEEILFDFSGSDEVMEWWSAECLNASLTSNIQHPVYSFSILPHSSIPMG